MKTSAASGPAPCIAELAETSTCMLPELCIRELDSRLLDSIVKSPALMISMSNSKVIGEDRKIESCAEVAIVKFPSPVVLQSVRFRVPVIELDPPSINLTFMIVNVE